jgi:hypothetical protein
MSADGTNLSILRCRADRMIPNNVGEAGHPYFIPLVVKNNLEIPLGPVTPIFPVSKAFNKNYTNILSFRPIKSKIYTMLFLSTLS